MVTLNLVTEADLANGLHGTIEDIILDLRENLDSSAVDKHSIMWTKYPPAMILFKPFFLMSLNLFQGSYTHLSNPSQIYHPL